MDKREKIIEDLSLQGLLPLYYHEDAATSIEAMKALYNGGIRTIEYTNRGPFALENFRKMKAVASEECSDLHLGVGTIKDETAANQFMDAGADFLISPALAEDVYDVAYSNKVLWIPGCMTPTEILKAEQFGVSLVKLFPGNILGPGYLKAIRELFPAMKFMPTGGVDQSPENLRSWFEAGVVAVGMGSKLVSRTGLDNREFAELGSNARALLHSIFSIRGKINSSI
jgi:2-dehydro-3-deoxyphosphogluconate aldolase / (4S)-4-hydroxy-2-oxoglutarate aldolase